MASPLELRLALAAAIGAVAMVLYLIGLLLAARIYGRFRRLRRANFVDAWEDYLASEKPAVTARILSLHPQEVHHLLRGWNIEVERSLALREAGASGQQARLDRLMAIAYSTELTHAAVAFAFRGLMRDHRLSGIQALGLIGRREVGERLLALTNDPDPLISLAALEATVRLNENLVIGHLHDLICAHPEWPEHAVSRIILKLSEASRTLLIDRVGVLSDACVGRVISTFERIHHAGATRLLRYKLSLDRPASENARLMYAVQDEGHIRLIEEKLARGGQR